jgi:hypothetical protein
LTYAPFERPGFVGPGDLPIFLAVVATFSAAFVAFAVRTLRREVTDGVPRRPRLERLGAGVRLRLFSWFPSPSLDTNPVLWREWHRSRPSKTARRIWLLYAVLSITATAYAVYDLIRYGTGSEAIIIVNAMEVTFGLLFVAATAPTVLSEERVRGSLDVLMSTPLPTREILLGKWWGVFRTVPLLMLLPAFTSILYVAAADPSPMAIGGMPPMPRPTNFDRVMGASLPICWILAHGAVIASVGVALATWISRPGRALACCVGYYVAATVGSVVVIETVINPLVCSFTGKSRGDSMIQSIEGGLLAFSPFGSQITGLETVTRMWMIDRGLLWYIQTVLLFVALGLSAGLLLLTIHTFNRALGRMPEEPRPVPERPALRVLTPEPLST